VALEIDHHLCGDISYGIKREIFYSEHDIRSMGVQAILRAVETVERESDSLFVYINNSILTDLDDYIPKYGGLITKNSETLFR
jgi:hypothetical protein